MQGDNWEFCILFVTLAAEMTGSHTSAEKKIKSILKAYHTFIVSLLECGKAQRFFDTSCDSKLNASIVTAFYNGILLQWYMSRKEVAGKVMARTNGNVILYGMAKNNSHFKRSEELS